MEAVLLLAHGTPSRVEEVPDYMRRVTGGRPIPQEVVDEVAHRFVAVGGSPLTRITLEQARLLQQALDMPVYVGMRNWHPLIADTVEQMVNDGVKRATVICLAPQYSRTSVGLYKARFEEASQGRIEAKFVEAWNEHPLLVEAFAERLTSCLNGHRTPVIFTAHSVPCRTVQSGTDGSAGDAYGNQAKRTAELVAQQVGVAPWYFAFQSQGMSGGPWIGPTVEATLEALASEGVRDVVVQPVGFVCDHVEILFDIDVDFCSKARELGIELHRPESLNTSPKFIAALAEIARGA